MSSRILPLILASLLLLIPCLGAAADYTPLLRNPDELKYEYLHFTPPRAERIVLENGIVLYFFRDDELPLLNVSVVLKAGSMFDPEGREGLAELTATVMRTGGTKNMSGDTVDDVLEFIAGTLTASVNKEYTSFGLSILTHHTDHALDILSQIIMNPAFEEHKLTRARDLKIEELRRIADDPMRFAFKEFNRLIYTDNPRGRSPLISIVRGITRDDLFQFHKKFFHPGNMMIAVSGNITKEQVLITFRRYFGAWNVPRADRNIPPPLPVMPAGGIYFLKKDIPQSIIISGRLAPSKKNPDSYSFEVLDFIVGSGGFRSRIFNEIRDKMGLAYSTGSFYRARGDYGVFGTYAMTRSESTATVLARISDVLNDIRSKSVEKNEIEWAKKSIINNFIFSFVSAEHIARQQLMIEHEKLPEHYLINYRDSISSVTAKKIEEVAGRYVLPTEKSVVLIMGNSNAYQQTVSSFGNVQVIEGKL